MLRRRSFVLERLEDRLAPSIVTPFTPRFSANATGDIAIIGNTLETASTVNNSGLTPADVTAAQNGVAGPNGNHVDNNDWNMAYVNVDTTTPGVFNSSTSDLTLPTGATVLFAGLYWGSVTTTPAQAAARNIVKFRTPTSGGYVSITGTVLGSFNFTGLPPGWIYQAFADVTSLVQAAGDGTYEVANVQAALRDGNGNLPYQGTFAGWSLVVAYSLPGAPVRNLTVFDGYAVQQSTDSPLTIPISGFIAPPAGTVNAKVGVVTYEGDLGITGDSMALNGNLLSDAAAPADNFFNSGISNLGVPVTAKNPNYLNQMGFGAKVINVPSGVIKNGDTSATITLSTGGDGYFPGVVTTAIDLYAPNLVDTKTITDLTSGGARRAVAAGDVLQYTVTVTNTGLDAAGRVVLTDLIPANTHYVPGSLQIVSGANAGSKTDAAGDDQAEFSAAGNDVIFRLGTGANATAGGTLAINASTTISFNVQVNPDAAANTTVANQATTAFRGVTTEKPFTSTSNVASVTVLGLSTAPNATLVTLGQSPVTLTDTATLAGGSSATGTITFTLFYNGGSTPVDTEKVTVNGNGNYTTPAGYTLPTGSAVTGTYQWNATYSGDNNNCSVSDNNATNERVTVRAASPTLTTQASAGGPEGSTTVYDTATLSGGYNETGNLTFKLEDAGNKVLFTSIKPASGNGTVTSDSYPLAEDGVYLWVVNFAGDANNNPVADFTSAQEQVIITEVAPALTTSASPVTATVGQTVSLSDTATLTGQAAGDTGTVTFTLTAPDKSTVFTSAAYPETGNFTQVTSVTLTLTQVGTYTWHAVYNDEDNLTPDTGTGEAVAVGKASPAVSTQASRSADGVVGVAVLSDRAILTGGYKPTGSLTFTLTQPDGATLTVGSLTVNGDGTYSAPTVLATQVGTYIWHVAYSGDSLNSIASDNGVNESLTTVKARPTVSTQAGQTAGKVVGTSVLSDTATISGGYNPTRTLTFTLTQPDGTTLTVGSVTVNGDGTYTAPTLLATQVGTYVWHAVYSGDGLNNGTSDNGVGEAVTTISASPALTTTQSPTSGVVGSAVLNDTAHLIGGYNPTGWIVFTLHAPDNSVAYTVTGAVTGDGDYTTNNAMAATEAGIYQWVASYTSDTNLNNQAISVLGSEPVTIIKASTATATTIEIDASDSATSQVSASDSVHDTATVGVVETVTGIPPPTGTVRYTFYQNGALVFSDSEAVGSDSRSTGPLAAGNYTFQAVYGGDAYYAGSTSDLEPLTVLAPSLVVTKTPDATSVNATDPVGFTITVSNATGVGTAYGVDLTDVLPGGLNWTASAGTISGGVLDYLYGDLAAGASFSVHVGAVTPAGYSATLANTATATPSNGAPASGSGSLTVLAPHLTITKTGNGTVNSTDTVRFTIVVSNTGPGTAYNVSISDPLPAAAHLAWTSDAGTISGGVLTDTIGDLTAGTVVTIHVSAVTPAGYSGILDNTATVTATNSSPGSVSASAEDKVLAPHLVVTKTPDATTITSPGTVGFTIIVSNAVGAGTAYKVSLTDPLPDGSLPWTTSAGTIRNGLLADAIGNLAPGASVSIHVSAVAPSGYSGVLPNTATATPTNGAPARGSGTEIVLAPGPVPPPFIPFPIVPGLAAVLVPSTPMIYLAPTPPTAAAPPSPWWQVYARYSGTLEDNLIEGTVWRDNNVNGERDPGEPGFENIRVLLDMEQEQGTYATVRSYITGPDGEYRFTRLPPGKYRVRLDLAPERQQTFPASNAGYSVVLSGSTWAIRRDFGIYSPAGSVVGGLPLPESVLRIAAALESNAWSEERAAIDFIFRNASDSASCEQTGDRPYREVEPLNEMGDSPVASRSAPSNTTIAPSSQASQRGTQTTTSHGWWNVGTGIGVLLTAVGWLHAWKRPSGTGTRQGRRASSARASGGKTDKDRSRRQAID
jgi:uncharacterized repeat protein (TIGR01451 family)